MSRANHRRRDTGPAETRPFQEGDDEAWIDWELTATSGRMMVRAPLAQQHAGAEAPPAGPRVDPRIVIAAASAVAVAAVAVGVFATRGDDTPDTAASPGVTTATATATVSTTANPDAPPTTPPSGPSAGNLVVNPSFEKSLAGWNAWQARVIRRDDNRAPHGSWIVRIVGTKRGAFAFAQNDPVRVTGWRAGSRIRGRAVVRAANRRSVGKVVVLRLRQRNAAGKVLGETASRPVRLTRAFTPVVVISRLRAPGARIDIRVSAESGWFKTRITPGVGVDADMVGMRMQRARPR